MANPAPFFNTQFFALMAAVLPATGTVLAPAAGYRLHTYATGTSTPKASYADQGEVATNPNPITLDADGRCALWLGAGEYAFELRTPAGALVKRWDDIAGVPASLSGAYLPLAGGATMTGRFDLVGPAQSALQPVTLQQMTDAITAGTGGIDLASRMAKSANLSDVASVATARTNLGVYSTAQVDAALVARLPAGMIMLWSGLSGAIPTGWVLCDGSNGTPNLRDRFVVGAGSTYSVGANGGATSTSVTLSSGNLPSHTHTFSATTDSDGAHTHTSAGGDTDANSGVAGTYVDLATNDAGFTVTTNSNGAHTHSVSGTSGATGSGAAVSVATLPPYYALCYVMKT